MKRSHGSTLVCSTLLSIVAACSPPVQPMADVLRNDASDTGADVVNIDAPSESGADADAGDSAADVVRDTGMINPACVPFRPEVGAGVGPGADRCEGYTPPANGAGATFCSLGADVPGLSAPPGFCIRRFANVGLPRVMAVAPNGDLFVTSPSTTTAAGDGGGMGAILVLSDDDHDGTATVSTFATGNLDSVHGITFQEGWVYFNTSDAVYRTPYTAGLRAEMPGMRQLVAGGAGTALGAQLAHGGRWTHGLASSVNNRLLVTRGEYSSCAVGPDGRPAPGIGEIYEVGMGSLTRVASGFRNPMYARCHFCRDLCMVAELGEDQTTGAVETLVVVNNNQWMGYPCCYQNDRGPRASSGMCNCIDPQNVKINLGDTPFGFDWERGRWPAPYRNGVFVALHGSFYLSNYQGAGVVYLPTDPATGVPLAQTPTRFIEGTEGSAQRSLRRPSDVVFARDGRLFVSDDKGGAIYWVAPTDLRL